VIEVDSSGFLKAEGNAKVFESLLNKIQGTATKTENSVKGLGDNFAAFQLVINKLPGPLKSIASGMLGMVNPATAATGAVIELTEAAIGFAKDSLQAFSDFEMIETNLEIVMGSAKQASQTFDELRIMAGRTPFNVDQLANVATQLKQVGVNAGDLIPTLRMLGNVSGGSMEKFNRVAFNYAQVISQRSATSMDMRQFAMAGIPIYDTLEKMGKAGSKSAEDIAEAFRIMTSEGGIFFNAMEKGAATLQGKMTNLEGVWKSFLATIAETSGLGEFIKSQIDIITKDINILNTILSSNKTVIDTAQSRMPNEQQSNIEAQIRSLENLNELEKELFQRGKDINLFSSILPQGDYINILAFLGFLQKIRNIGNDDRVASLKEELELLIEQNREYNKNLDLIEELKTALENEKKSYQDIFSLVDETYQKTEEARKEEIESKIKRLEEFLAKGKKFGMQTIYGPSGQVAHFEGEVDLDEEDINKTKLAIAYYQEELEKGRGKLKTELELWKKILIDNTGFTIEQMEKMWAGLSSGKSLPVIEQFEQVMAMRRDTHFSLFGDDIDNQIQVAQNAIDIYRKLYEDMFTVTLDKDGNIITVWTESEEAAQEAKKAWKDAVGVLDNANFNKYLDDSNKAAKLLEGTPADRVRESITQTLQSQGMSASDEQIQATLTANADMFGKEIQAELNLVLKNSHDEAIARLMIERNISEVDAERLLKEQENLDYIKNGHDYMAEIEAELQDALEKIRSGQGGYGEAARALAGQAGMNLIQGTDTGAFTQGTEMGGPGMGVINMFIESLASVLGGMEGLEMILSPITTLLQGFSPLLKALLVPLLLVSAGMKVLAGILEGLFGWLVGDLDDLYDSLTASNDEREKEVELLKKLNEQYKKLRDSIEEQEEYYLKKRRELNANWAIESLGVNDMILTPQGNFSTNPNDYIIATKNPSTLGNNVSVPVYVNVINNSTSTVTAQEQTDPDGAKRITVLVDQVVQNGIASGKYDSAFNAKQVRDSGRRVSG
jgi:hypothetical protein